MRSRSEISKEPLVRMQAAAAVSARSSQQRNRAAPVLQEAVVQRWLHDSPIQRRQLTAGYSDIIAAAHGPFEPDPDVVRRAARAGTAGPAGRLPFVERIQQSFGQHDVSNIQSHTDAAAAAGARMMGAAAFASGNHVAFGDAPSLHTAAHEAAHVVQQRGGVQLRGGVGRAGDAYERHADQVADLVVRGESSEALLDMPVRGPAATASCEVCPRAHQTQGAPQRPGAHGALVLRKSLGTKVTHSAGSKSKFKKVTGAFDGSEFVMRGDGAELLRGSAQSGRPYTVTATDAKGCGGSTSDSYLNNPRYVGIKDNGPIPEGRFRFRATGMATFDAGEQSEMLLGGSYTDPFGISLHGGDWGAGRVALEPTKIEPSAFCGKTSGRSGFYLHGGVMPGSSGCIDVGNDAFMRIVALLAGYRSDVTVTVKYAHAAPAVGVFDRALGRFMYPDHGKKQNPGVLDRIKSALGGDD